MTGAGRKGGEAGKVIGAQRPTRGRSNSDGWPEGWTGRRTEDGCGAGCAGKGAVLAVFLSQGPSTVLPCAAGRGEGGGRVFWVGGVLELRPSELPQAWQGPRCQPARLGRPVTGQVAQDLKGRPLPTASRGPNAAHPPGWAAQHSWTGLSCSRGRVTLASRSTLSLSFPLHKTGTIGELAPWSAGGQCG